MFEIIKQQEGKSNFWMHKLCWFLLITNVGWVLIHMFFHYQGALNPWKLGGYAMYTQPSPFYYAVVGVAGGTTGVSADDKVLKYLNLYATGGCLSGISKRFYKKIPFMNSALVTDKGFTRMTFYEQNRSLLERTKSHSIIGQATLTLDKEGIMTVEEEFCGKQRKFSINAKRYK